ncbi:ABC transporter ATP-binding protein, partial [Corallococcus coralloides]|nr:ABC transporter ATP-binding protein [Corallococcus coralloides]
DIVVAGRDITHSPPEQRNITMVFQSYALWPHLTVARNIGYGLKLRRWRRDDIDRRVAELLQIVNLSGLAEMKVTELSGGQRQRVAMARAIVRNPRLFLMDEPLSNLDARLRSEVRDSIMDLHQQLKTSTVYVTHDQTEAMSMADRIVVMNAGHVQQVGRPEHLYAHPAN